MFRAEIGNHYWPFYLAQVETFREGETSQGPVIGLPTPLAHICAYVTRTVLVDDRRASTF